MTPEGGAGPALRRRLAAAAVLWQEGVAPWLVVSGGATGPGDAAVTEAAVMARRLVDRHGIPAAAVVLEEASQDTLGNARETLALAAERGWRRLVVVTDELHLPRALWTFRRLARPLGIAVEGHAAPPPRRLTPAWWSHAAREAAACLAYAYRLQRAAPVSLRGAAALPQDPPNTPPASDAKDRR
ncbi:YdcF family protein [Caenispirillum bisanense]|uniref:YdcF family protein n=1 Tax=Caenispirillum bisanense TaxID=414052 RepID=UPI0015964B1E|nr:YdcF family protein [Caenispirillum bisanense]